MVFRCFASGGAVVDFSQNAAEIEPARLVGELCRVNLNQIGATDDVVELAEAHLSQILAHLFGHKHIVVNQILAPSKEPLAQFRVLSGHAHRAGVGVALAHKNAAQNNQLGSAKGELASAQQSHCHHVAASFELAVGLHLD